MDLEAIALRRAEEQMETVNLAGEPVSHDRWAIKPGEVRGRAFGKGVGWRRARCLACERPTWRGTPYCQKHCDRVRKGEPVDMELYRLTDAERRRLSRGRPRFGGGINFGGGR